uniref:AN1-type domain-containing protein n=1 Tax=Schistosoma haematobium TaxID=6185 RepID=A0A095A0U2_SCHHA
MIRRIIDSVSLLVDPEPQNNMELLTDKDYSVNASMDDDSDNVNKDASNGLSDMSPSFTGRLESYLSNGCINECSSSSIALSNSNSCYIASEDNECSLFNTPTNEATVTLPVRSVRNQSQSPGMVDLSSIPLRSLPGGPSLQHARDRLKLNTRKKETYRCQNNIRSCLTAPVCRKIEQDNGDFETDGCFSQVDPLVMELECYILPFYRNLTECELKLPIKFAAKIYRAEYELLILSVGKDRLHDECLVVRKRGTLQQKQELELEERKEKQRQKQLREKEAKETVDKKEEIKIEKLQTGNGNLNGHQEMCCQASFDEQGREWHLFIQIGRKRAKRIRKERERRKQAERNKKIIHKIDCSIQTIPEDYWYCSWCNEHIPPISQCGHEAICRAGVQQKQIEIELKTRLKQHQLHIEAKKRQRLGLPPLKNEQQHNNSKKKNELIFHSRSQSHNHRDTKSDKLNSTKQEKKLTPDINNPTIKAKTASAKLGEVHPNDVEAMIKLMQRLCTESKCKLLADSDGLSLSNSKCPKCKRAYCLVHRPIGKHTACPLNSELTTKECDGTTTSIACGWDSNEKKEALKLALRERKAKLRELRERC